MPASEWVGAATLPHSPRESSASAPEFAWAAASRAEQADLEYSPSEALFAPPESQAQFVAEMSWAEFAAELMELQLMARSQVGPVPASEQGPEAENQMWIFPGRDKLPVMLSPTQQRE